MSGARQIFLHPSRVAGSFSKTPRTKPERAALEDLTRVVDGLAPTAAKELRAGFSSRGEDLTDDALSSILQTGNVPKDLRASFQRFYASVWTEGLGHHTGDAASAGRDYAGVAGDDPEVRSAYLDERGEEWTALMAAAQADALKEARVVCLEYRVEEADALEVLKTSAGLAPRDAGAVARQQADAVSKRRDFRPGVFEKALKPAVARRVTDLLKRRAFLTADYELTRAYNGGKRLAHAQALKLGLVTEVNRRWVTELDEDVCEICGPLHGKELLARKAGSLYNLFDRVRKIYDAPAHMRCRCTVIYEVVT